MFKKILIIPDVHGRNFWKLPSYDDYDKIIFLGDYLDHYYNESTNEYDIENFKEILEFKKNNPDKVILLLGNHDFGYYNEDIYKQQDYWCRHDHKNHDIIHELFEKNKDFFQLYWICDNFCKSIKQDKILFTHAGFTNGFYKLMCDALGVTSIEEICDKLIKPENHAALVGCVSWYRGGFGPFGSIVWSDVREHNEIKDEYLKQYYQIFGHTYAKNEIEIEDFAMLDTGKYCFELNSDELRRISSNNE